MAILVSNLSRSYGDQRAVNDISFTVPDNEIVGFLGPNGAGKSTTMKMITGYLPPHSGSIRVNGIDVNSSPLQVKKEIGYLPESNPLYYEMYVREYLEFIAGTHQIKKPADRIEEVIRLTGLTPESNKKAGQLSKGYKQRLGLAAALIHDPKVLILDEPTSGLDPNQIVEIRELIRNLGKNKSVLFSSHILQEIESICDRVVIINKGNIVADDKLENLQFQDRKAQTVSVQFAQKADKNALSQLTGVDSVFEENNIFQLSTRDASQLKKQLLEFSIQNGLDILSLQTQSRSLEEIFRKLTL